MYVVLNVIIEKVKECYASTFTDRATYYRVKQGFDHMTVALSAAVQMMVFSKAAGVMFTVDLVTGNDNNILIEVLGVLVNTLYKVQLHQIISV